MNNDFNVSSISDELITVAVLCDIMDHVTNSWLHVLDKDGGSFSTREQLDMEIAFNGSNLTFEMLLYELCSYIKERKN